jgi:hypothetical protein
MPAVIARKRAICGQNGTRAVAGCGQPVTEMFSTGYPWWMPSRTTICVTLPLVTVKFVIALPGPVR